MDGKLSSCPNTQIYHLKSVNDDGRTFSVITYNQKQKLSAIPHMDCMTDRKHLSRNSFYRKSGVWYELSIQRPAKKRLTSTQDCGLTSDVRQTDCLADGGSTMSRKRSSHIQNRLLPSIDTGNKGQSGPAIDNWLSADTPYSTLKAVPIPKPIPAPARSRGQSRSIAVTAFEPDDYCKLTSPQPSPNHGGSFNARRTSSNFPWQAYQHASSTLSSSSFSESMTSPIECQTNPTSVNMSRQTSFVGNSYCSNLQKLNLSSNMSRRASSVGHNNSSLNNFASPMAWEPNTLSASFDTRQVLSHTGGAADDKKLSDAFDRRPPILSGTDEVAVSMHRADSANSNGSTSSRSSRRSRERVPSNTRTLAPKAGSPPSTSVAAQKSLPAGQSMGRTESCESQNGQVAIPRVPYTRHVPNKVKCEECNEHADGFKGEHELKRHILRAHRPTRKVYVCIDPTPSKDFLSDCEHCKAFKRYNAYYNAAAHLRRRHFNKRPKGERRKGKLTKEERRGGKGGGTEPRMEVLKLYMREFEIYADGNPLNDPDMAYSTANSIAASAQQSSGEIDNQPITEVAADTCIDIDDMMFTQNDAHAAQPSSSPNSCMQDTVYGQAHSSDGMPSASPKSSPFISDYSQQSSIPSDRTPATFLQKDLENDTTDHIDAESPQHYDPPLFDNVPTSLDQFLELNFEDMFSFSQN